MRSFAALAFCIITSAAAALQADDDPAMFDSIENLERERTWTSFHASLLLPDVGKPQLLALIESLELEPAQQAAAEGLLNAYLARSGASVDRARRRIQSRIGASFRYDAQRAAVRPTVSPVLVELLETHVDLLDRTLNADRQFFGQLVSLVPSSRRDDVRYFELQRMRALLPHPPRDRLAHLDVEQLLGDLDLSEIERDQVDGILATQYATHTRGLRESLRSNRAEVELPRAQFILDVGPYWRQRVQDADTRDAILAQLNAFEQREIDLRLLDRVSQLETLIAVAQRLTARNARAFRSLLVESLWPWFNRDAETVFAASQSTLEALREANAEDQSIMVERMQAQLRDTLDAVTQRALESLLDTDEPLHALVAGGELDATGSLAPGEVPLPIEERWIELRISRRAPLLRHLDFLLGVARAQQFERTDAIESLRDTMRSYQQADRYRVDELEDAQRSLRADGA